MAFETFTDTSKTQKPRASIRANGTISLNSAAVRRFSLSKEVAPYFVLAFDKDTNRIGMRAELSAEASGAHQVHYGKAGASFSATRFLDFFEIPRSTERSEIGREGDLIVFSINKEGAKD